MKCPYCKSQFSPKNRSNSQNAYYWGCVLPMIEDETGHTVDELHQYFKGHFLAKVAMVFDVAINHPKSTTELTTEEFKRYIEQIVMFVSAELGISIPEPDERNKNEHLES